MTRAAPPRTMAEFDDRHGRFAGGGRVHDVALQPWIEGLEVPGPACHTPNGSFDPASFRPVDDPVSCRRCLRSGTPDPVHPVDQNQLPLFSDRDTPRCSNGCDGPCICDHPDDCPCGCADNDGDREDPWCGCRDDPDCPRCNPTENEDEQPCPAGCTCAWCTGRAFIPRIVTARPDPAYL
ncbi:hypothetical protein [Actinocrispum wychmicini]|uniref:Uncharacterized protein n=1 Tax=Actinocrispum wychmicini TaxID=1213861 RepID=A0A4R2JC94_9PSEU|nr:hypothetical protein [Actinocrispum wychmicini]TCO57163.1 hypothetical protein EV192_106640 [Actinocrispum wychmicini]